MFQINDTGRVGVLYSNKAVCLSMQLINTSTCQRLQNVKLQALNSGTGAYAKFRSQQFCSETWIGGGSKIAQKSKMFA